MLGSNIQSHDTLEVVPLRERAAAAIRSAIFDGRLAPGAEIRQEDLAERFGISRMPIREAFQILEFEGLIERQSHRRVVVSSFSPADVVDHYEARALVEGELAARAARRTEQHAALEAALEQASFLARDGAPTPFSRGSRIFHEAIWTAAGSSRLHKIALSLWTGLPIHLPEMNPAMVPHSNDEHRAIFEAVITGDPELARSRLSGHILGCIPGFFRAYQAGKGTAVHE